MAREFRLPDLGEGLTEAEIVSWLVKEGEEVALNQPLVEVETEKALVEIPSPFEGVVAKLHSEVGDKVEVGSVIVSFDADGADGEPEVAGDRKEGKKEGGRREVLVGYGPEEEGAGGRRRRRKIGKRGADEPAAEEPEEPDATEAEEEPEPEPEPAKAPAPAAKKSGATVRALATPPVRKLAKDLGIDIDELGGTGPGGRVTREDVMAAAKGDGSPAKKTEPAAAAAAKQTHPAGGEERIPVRAIRRSIAEKMVRSYSEIPHVTEWLEVDATELMRLRKDLAGSPEATDGKMSPLPVIVKALVAALRKHPLINSAWDSETNEIIVKHYYNVGIAADTERGLLVPVIRNADQMNVFEISDEIRRLAVAARDKTIGPNELSGSTITITNIGSFGMDGGTPIINYPESSILAPGAIRQKPWVVDGKIEVREVMTLGLSFDHRIVDGAEAGRFLRYLADLIEKPARLFGVL
ncbi:MAG TPA: dihydrolipoamide acetyltransferase family protein [Actinomycetota bacterium]|nr:dihydrolipoamide acetyltransferase family protein [Actinomycetota bacterium]